MVEAVIETVGVHENPFSVGTFPRCYSAEECYFSKRIGYTQLVDAFQRGNNRVPARPVKGKLIISGQEDEISGLGRGLIVQAYQNIKK